MKAVRAFLVALLAVVSTTPSATGASADVHSPNMSLVANFNDKGAYASGSDIAFWGNLAAFGNENPGGFRLLDISKPAAPKQLSQFACSGAQSDVSMWGDLVFVSVDTAMASPACDSNGASDLDFTLGRAWEGVRIVSIADRAKPVQIAAVDTDCGSHTHTLVPDLEHNRLLIYVLSYPLTAYSVDCNPASHHKISVISVPLDVPAKAAVVSTPDVGLVLGCHDVTVFPQRKLAAAACLSESQIWDISDPVNPRVVAEIVNPLINIHHSTAWSWDGNTIVIGDELGGASVAAGCLTHGKAPFGGLWFYDVTDAANPVLQGSYVIPRNYPWITCTAHNFDVIPLTSGRDVLVTAWYSGGTAVIDFTDPANPTEIGYDQPLDGQPADAWSSYFYNGYIYVNNLGTRGVDVLRLSESFLSAAVPLAHLNAQSQERLPLAGPSVEAGGAPPPGAPKQSTHPPAAGQTRPRSLPGTGVGAPFGAAAALIGASALVRRRLRRV